MVIIIDAEKSFDKIQHPFMIKKKKPKPTLNRLGIEGNLISLIKPLTKLHN